MHKFSFKIFQNIKDCDIKKVITFTYPPKGVDTGLIFALERKIAELKSFGIDEIITLDFEKVKNLSPVDFFSEYILKNSATKVSVGFNFRFGKGAVGDSGSLCTFCKNSNIICHIIEPVIAEGIPISSSHIRQLLNNGEIAKANSFLPLGFSFTGEVIHGDKRGRTIGFPTINQLYPSELCRIQNGVYKTITVIDNKKYNSISNIGLRPTYKVNEVLCETHIPGFSGDVYGKCVTIMPVEFIRGEKKFNSIEDLKIGIAEDLNNIRS